MAKDDFASKLFELYCDYQGENRTSLSFEPTAHNFFVENERCEKSSS